MLAVPILFILLGILIKYAKMYFLIAGYNTMSKEEKSKYDVEGIASVMRNAMFGMAFIMIMGYFISKWMKDPQIEMISMFGLRETSTIFGPSMQIEQSSVGKVLSSCIM